MLPAPYGSGVPAVGAPSAHTLLAVPVRRRRIAPVRVLVLGGLLAVLAVALMPTPAGAAAGGFSDPVTINLAGGNPKTPGIGDFNGDGDPDLAIPKPAHNTVSILLGAVGGTFTGPTNVGVGAGPEAVAVGDFNGDTDPDLATANANANTVSILLGAAGGTFAAATHVAVGSVPVSVAAGDFDGDADQDLAVTNYTANSVTILVGDGTGAFPSSATMGVGNRPRSVVVADFQNGDSDPDLAVVEELSDSVRLLYGGAGATFPGAAVVAVGDGPNKVVAGDFNGDTDPDLAVSNFNSDSVSVLLGGAMGSFSGATHHTVGDGPQGLAVGDFNGDTDPDLAVPNGTAKSISVLLGGAGGSFSATTAVTLSGNPVPQGIAAADLDGDGEPDLAVTRAFGFAAQMDVMLGIPSAAFTAPTNFPANQPYDFAVGDVSGDGDQDLVLANAGSDNGQIWFGASGGGFTAGSALGTGDAPRSVAMGDFNEDGFLDVAIGGFDANIVTFWYFGPGGSLLTGNSAGVGLAPRSIAVGEFNGDSDPDLAVANSGSNDVSILLGAPGTTYGGPFNFGAGGSPRSVAVGEFNGDGDPDLAVANSGTDNVSILLGGAGGGFTGPTNFNAGTGPQSVVVGDFDGDGDDDLAVANVSTSNVSILPGDGTGAFGAATNVAVGNAPQSVAVGDFNGDGDPDLVAANFNTNNASILLGAAGRTFVPLTHLAAENGPQFVAVGDFNQDTDDDFIVTNRTSSSFSVFLGDDPPDTVIDDGPPEPTSDTTPEFTFHSTQPDSTFECRVDAAGWAPCTSPHVTGALSDGPHTFHVRATDESANTDPTPAFHAFTVDGTPPDTTITSGPHGTTGDDTPTFAFETEPSSTFQCRLDLGAWAACVSPHTTDPLPDGPHVFHVRAIDGVGNDDPSPAVEPFTVVSTPGSVVGWGGVGPPPAGTDHVAISAGHSHGLALRSDGSIVGWGNNSSGQATPPAGTDFVAVSAGNLHSLALRSDGSIAGWGNDTHGRASPPAGNDFVAIAAGENHSLALRSDGSIVGWGSDSHGQATSPAGNEFVAVAAGRLHSLGLRTDGTIVGWGSNSSGEATPPAGGGFVAVSAGYEHSLALDGDGEVVGFGRNVGGETQPPPGGNFVAMGAGGYHSVGLRSNGTIAEWGLDLSVRQLTPPLGNQYVAVAAGFGHSLALSVDTTPPSDPTPSGLSHDVNVPSSDDTVEITWEDAPASDPGSGIDGFSFEWSTDAGTLPDTVKDAEETAAGTTSPMLADGSSHWFHLRTRDNAGNWTSTVHLGPFVIDTVAPAVSVDSGPGITNDPTPTFTFSATDALDATPSFECKLDDGGFAACTDAGSHTPDAPVADGDHTFHVRATDDAENSATDSQDFTVDTVEPADPVLDSPSHDPGVASSDTTVEATWAGAADDRTGVDGFSFEWSTDAETLPDTDLDEQGDATGATSDPLADGSWWFHLRTRDNAGNWTSTVHRGPFIIDTTPPETTIDAGPSGTVYQPNAEFTFSADEAATFQCDLDDGGFESCESPVAYTGLADGLHTFRVRAIDVAGNQDLTPEASEWTVGTPVQKTVKLRASRNRVPEGGRIRLFAIVRPCPDAADESVTFQRRSRRGWRDIATRALNDRCRASIRQRVMRGTVFRAVSRRQSDALLADISNRVRVRAV